MFFPVLTTMRCFKVKEIIINNLDTWLGTRRQAVRKFLSPLQFSMDFDIDAEYSTEVFWLCTTKEISILKLKYVVNCPVCDSILGTFYSEDDIPETFGCRDCGSNLKVTDDNIRVWFELLQNPENEPHVANLEAVRGRSVGLGKDFGLRIVAVRGLMDRLDERYRSVR